jgi:hypothetical protein
MRLSWNEIRARAAEFARKYAAATYEKGETQSFYNDFFEVFGVQRRKVASFEAPVKLLGTKRGFIDLFWKGVLLVEQKSAGRSLVAAKTQALDYFPGLKDAELPRYILVSDFQTFELHDLEDDTYVAFPLHVLHQNIEHFGFIMGVQKRAFKDQDPVNVEAAALMGKLHDALKASGYAGPNLENLHDLEQFLVRLVFCLFADDTGIFPDRAMFLDLITQRTRIDGSDIGPWLAQLFDVLNTPDETQPINRRQKALDEDLAKFPYINGDLFKERLPIPAFDAAMRALLIEACEFNWDAISPAIFGSLFQSVMNAKERRAAGAHYTTEKNILKVIGPLFLDDLKAEFARITARRGPARAKELAAFQDRLAKLTFFDPACGCGNFLIIAYRELRALEIALLRELYPQGQRVLDVKTLSKIDVNQFYGIEIGEFAARIAEVALWMMDHIMNNRLSLEFGEAYARIPLVAAPHIHHADALELDWESVLAATDCSYVLGNPPFIGKHLLSVDQSRAMARLFPEDGMGALDYVCAWLRKAGAYVQGAQARIGFVSTNSITQGEQVAQLWPLLFERYGLEIAFAHRTFAWGSDARGMAHVHVVIIGLARRGQEPTVKRLFSYDKPNSEPVESQHTALSPYLFDAGLLQNRHLVVERERHSLGGKPNMCVGSKPVDGGHYIFDGAQKTEFLASEPGAASIMRPFIGGRELINSETRWILYPDGIPTQELRKLPSVMNRIARVRTYREESAGNLANELASMPTRFHVNITPQAPFLCIPEVSSERRSYVPIGWLEPPTIPSNKLLIVQDADLCDFGMITSAMHMAWLRHIGGRLKSDYRYSIGIVYNTFPWPSATDAAKAKIRALAQDVLDARAAHPQATLADLYDPDVMPPNLRKAHKALDAAVDKLYRPQSSSGPFASDRERVEHLFKLYEELTTDLVSKAQAKPAKPKRKAKAILP